MKTFHTTLAASTLLLLGGCATLDSGNTQQTQPHMRPAGEAPEIDTQLATAAGAQSPETPATETTGSATPPDFWEQLRQGMQLAGAEQHAVSKQVRVYSSSPQNVEDILQRGEPYLAYIHNQVRQRGFPSEIALLPFIESGYDPFAYSQERATGLWQFIPGTGKQYGLKQDWWYDGRRDIIASTAAALDYLDKLQQRFDGDWLLALAAYNSGGGRVRKAIRNNRKAGRPTDFWHLELPGETTAYIPRLLAISTIVQQPQQYGVELPPVDMSPAFAVVDTQGQLDIGIAAELAGISTDEIYRLNPGYNRWATHPKGPHQLAIPATRTAVFEQNLATLPDTERIKWVRHRIDKGETLSHIAGRYHTTVAVLRETNQLKGRNIRAGKHLLVPVAARDPSRYAGASRHLQPGSSAASKLTYKVRDGDSLWKIAHSHKVSVKQISTWNQLDDSALLRPGQQLVIWQDGRAGGNGKRLRAVSYTVRSGDSLYRISRKYNVSINELRRWNNLPKGKHLQPGQNLKLYVDVTRLTQRSHG
jgi:membrane-bound lytic murein transglycosylase D